MKENEEGLTRPVVDENGCQKCNACMLFCPIYNPVELPEFETFYDSAEDVRKRDMAPIYRATMREAKAGKHVEFVGTLCQIAALKSLRGDKLSHNIAIYPVYCDEEQRKSSAACAACRFYEK
jgi:coenzyme F420-reducing hydrogenase beta subunit